MNFRKRYAAAAFITAAMGMFVFSGIAATPACMPPKDGDWTHWLKKQESTHVTYMHRPIRGHTLTCLVGVKTDELIRRIESRDEGECQLSAETYPGTGTWKNRSALITQLESPEMQIVLKDAVKTRTAGTIEISGMAGQIIGTTVAPYTGRDRSNNRNPCGTRTDYTCQAVEGWKMILLTSGTDCILLTAYPVR